jgi:ATP-dependent RNA helicase RhlE
LESAVSFASLGLSAATLRTLERVGFTQPTPIQAQAVPPGLAGRDVVGIAATGTGKTAAFLLPCLERPLPGPVLVLAPTRELALQIAEQVERLGGPEATLAVVMGGVGSKPQVKALAARPRFIVATPGRLVDHLDERTVSLDKVSVLVMDEADRMLDMGFRPQLNRILRALPQQRQTMLFSATMGDEVAAFIRQSVRDAVRVEVAKSGTTAARATQQVFELSQDEKTPQLLALLEEDEDSTLVFTRTKRRADKVWKALERAGLKAARIHADRSQAQRVQALEGFRDGKYRVLVATDIAARGIDVAEIGHVVNYDLPHVPADYVHRIGRTARAAASGRASSFCAPEEAELLRDIEKFTRARVDRGVVERDAAAFQAEFRRAAEGRARQPTSSPGGGGRGGPPARGGRPGGGARAPRGGGRPGTAASGGQRQAGQGGGAPAPTGRTVFSGGPRRGR